MPVMVYLHATDRTSCRDHRAAQGDVMALHWIKEDTPRWDPEKQRLFGPEELAAVGYEPPSPGSVIANEWWRVTDDEGAVPTRLG
jgi:hypothetical protein